MSVKDNLFFITQTVASAGAEVMILTVAYLLYVSICMFVPVLLGINWVYVCL